MNLRLCINRNSPDAGNCEATIARSGPFGNDKIAHRVYPHEAGFVVPADAKGDPALKKGNAGATLRRLHTVTFRGRLRS
jgi:hypothetical protein